MFSIINVTKHEHIIDTLVRIEPQAVCGGVKMWRQVKTNLLTLHVYNFQLLVIDGVGMDSFAGSGSEHPAPVLFTTVSKKAAGNCKC